MGTKWLLILWFAAGTSGHPSMKGDIYNISYEDEESCKNALVEIRKQAGKQINGVCTPTKKYTPGVKLR